MACFYEVVFEDGTAQVNIVDLLSFVGLIYKNEFSLISYEVSLQYFL